LIILHRKSEKRVAEVTAERSEERKTGRPAEAWCPNAALVVFYYLHEKKRITVFYGKVEGCGQVCFWEPSKYLLE
jgi:hypothetical protein